MKPPGCVVWVTGLPSSGKSTLAARVHERLSELRLPTLLLDGDIVRAALVPPPGYDPDARDAFYRTLGNLAALAARQGLIVSVAATAHQRRWRDAVRTHAPRFVEVHVATPIEECRRRDDKGLYAAGAPGLPGTGSAYEPPESAEVVARGGRDEEAVEAVLRLVGAR